MKLAVIILSLINGTYMLIDGIYVIMNKKYIGPEKPGPWANIFSYFNIDVFKLGPLFIVFGLAWICFALAYLYNMSYAFVLGMIMALTTIWYLPFGTIISLIVLALIFIIKI